MPQMLAFSQAENFYHLEIDPISLQVENYRNYSIVFWRQTTRKVRSFSLGSTPRGTRANIRGGLAFYEENNVGKESS